MMARTSGAALCVAALLAALAGCSTAPTDPNAPASEPKEYRTGSNIPVRDRNSPSQAQNVKPDDPSQMRPVGLPPMGNTARP